MLRPIEGLGANVVAFEAVGVVTAEDYADQLVPAVEAVLEQGLEPRLLYVLGPEFERFELAAVLADAKVGLGHLSDFERIAVVTDHEWVARTVGGFGVLIPCPVQVFAYAELNAAATWVATAGGDSLELSIEVVDRAAVVHVRLRGSLNAGAEEQFVRAAREGVSDAEEVRVLVEAVDFHGWRDVRALWQHVRFVGGMRSRIRRVAIVGDATWQRRLVATARHVLRVDARFFPEEQLARARDWIGVDEPAGAGE
jgi:hypothetical protein